MFHALGELEAVHFGHLRVEHDQLKWTPGFGGFFKCRQRLLTAFDRDGIHFPGGQLLLKNSAVGEIVVDDEGGQAAHRFERERRRFGMRFRQAEARGEMKFAPASQFALDPNLAAHQLDQARRNAQAEAGAAVISSGGAIRLNERFENSGLLLGSNADAGIGNDGVQAHIAIAPFADSQADDHFAAMREFDGVAGEIDDDLAQTAGIAGKSFRDVVLHIKREFETFFMSA